MPRVGMTTIFILPLSSVMSFTPSCLPPWSVLTATFHEVAQTGVMSMLSKLRALVSAIHLVTLIVCACA